MQAADPIRASSTTIVDDAAFTLCLSIFAVSLAVFAASASAGGRAASAPTASTPGQSQEVGTLTGKHASGAPVYRLPAVSVSASRGIEMARIEQEDRRTPVTVVAQTPGKPPARALVAFRDAQD